MEQQRIKTVIFDLDGTLLDTEKYFCVCWPKALERFGYAMTEEQALTMRSMGQPFALIHLKEMFGEEVDYQAVRACRRELMEECLAAQGIEVKKGAVELLSFLKEQGIPAAIATASDVERTKRYLKETGLLPYFTRIISATMVEKGKPAPDVYLFACEELGAAPGECLAVEDSPNGVKSAYEAGCKVVMVPDLTQPDEQLRKMLYACVESLSDIRILVK